MMETNELIKIAEECGAYTGAYNALIEFSPDQLQQFAERIAQIEQDRIANEAKHIIKRAEERGAKAEREACAEICDELAECSQNPYNFAENCAERIRGRGK